MTKDPSKDDAGTLAGCPVLRLAQHMSRSKSVARLFVRVPNCFYCVAGRTNFVAQKSCPFACPNGWTLTGGATCTAPASYQGTCRTAIFDGYLPIARKNWAENVCGVQYDSWKCGGVSVSREQHDCSVLHNLHLRHTRANLTCECVKWFGIG